MHRPGIEPGPPAWQASILPLNQRCRHISVGKTLNMDHTVFWMQRTLLSAVVAEWLRRLTRNEFPFGSVGSNPTNCENILIFSSYCDPAWNVYIRSQSNWWYISSETIFGKITIYGQMEIKFQFGIGRPFPNANIQVWKWNSISKNYNIITWNCWNLEIRFRF